MTAVVTIFSYGNKTNLTERHMPCLLRTHCY